MKTTKARLLSTYRAARRNMARTVLKVGLEKAWPAAWQRAIFGSTRDLAAVKSVVRASTPTVEVVATADVQADTVKVEPVVENDFPAWVAFSPSTVIQTVVADEVGPIPPAADAEPVALKKPRARKPAAPKAETPRKAAAKAPKPETAAKAPAVKAPAAPRKRVAKAKAA